MADFTKRDEQGNLRHVRLDAPIDIDGLCRLVLLATFILLITWKVASWLEAPIGAAIVSAGILEICAVWIVAAHD